MRDLYRNLSLTTYTPVSVLLSNNQTQINMKLLTAYIIEFFEKKLIIKKYIFKGGTKMTATTYLDVWDLDVFFTGGSDSPELQEYISQTEAGIKRFESNVNNWTPVNSLDDAAYLQELLAELEGAAKKLIQAGAFVGCLLAQNTDDKKAYSLDAKITSLSAVFQTAIGTLDNLLTTFDDAVWQQLIASESLRELSFVLTESREKAKEKLSKEEEAVISTLEVDGYHSWGQLYDLIVSKIKVPFNENDEEKQLSVGQAFNKFSSPDREVRAAVFKSWEKAWGEQADFLAKTLNHLAGFRLSVYKKRGWEDVLKEPLSINRMKKETLDTMWTVITENKQKLVHYLERKAKLSGLEKLSWFDLDAPYGKTESKVSYQEGAEFIEQNFGLFGEKLAAFAKNAFLEQWIEAEDRPGKAPGGFCTYLPESVTHLHDLFRYTIKCVNTST
jgi:oligoendopeptidase F